MSHKKASNAQILACQEAGLSSTEAARELGVSQACIASRAKTLKITFANKRGQRKAGSFTCATCPEKKLCLLCHRTRVLPLPCEKELPAHRGKEILAMPPLAEILGRL